MPKLRIGPGLWSKSFRWVAAGANFFGVSVRGVDEQQRWVDSWWRLPCARGSPISLSSNLDQRCSSRPRGRGRRGDVRAACIHGIEPRWTLGSSRRTGAGAGRLRAISAGRLHLYACTLKRPALPLCILLLGLRRHDVCPPCSQKGPGRPQTEAQGAAQGATEAPPRRCAEAIRRRRGAQKEEKITVGQHPGGGRRVG